MYMKRNYKDPLTRTMQGGIELEEGGQGRVMRGNRATTIKQ